MSKSLYVQLVLNDWEIHIQAWAVSTRLSQATHIAWSSAAVTDIFPQLPV